MASLQFSEKDFLRAAKKEEDFTNTADKGFEPGAETYLKEFYGDALENDFLDYSLKDLVTLAREFWMFGNRRKTGEILLKVSDSPTPEGAGRPDTAIQIVTDNMSFLVDSLVAAISSFGIDVSGLFHPVVFGRRDEEGRWLPATDEQDGIYESMILLMVPPQNKKMQAALEEELRQTLEDVGLINADFKPLVKSVKITAIELSQTHGNVPEDVITEAVEFLNWIAEGNFVFFGSRRYNYLKDSKSKADYVHPATDKEHTFGLLRDPELTVLRQSSEPSVITSNVKAFMEDSPPVTVAKSNVFSRVHRRVRMDYVSVKSYNEDGHVVGETRYVGLFTSEAYSRSPQAVPLLREKVARVKREADLHDGSHNAKRLDYVLDSYPRDELFQIGHEDLLRISTGVAKAFDRPRTRLFVRRDPFERFVSALVYVPLEHYNARVRAKIGIRLKSAFGGRISAFYPQYSDAPMARVHFIIGMDPDCGKEPDLDDLEAEIAAIAQPWFSGLTLAAEDNGDVDLVSDLPKYRDAFTIAYQDRFASHEALADLKAIRSLTEDNPIAVRVYDTSLSDGDLFKAKFYRRYDRFEPSSVIPMLGNFAVHVVEEAGYCISPNGEDTYWMSDFEFKLDCTLASPDNLATVFEDAIKATWMGLNEDDRFNRLILPQGTNWRDIAFLRLLAQYRRQTGQDPSESTQIEALERYPALTRKLLEFFHTKFDPDGFDDFEDRKAAVETFKEDITVMLNDVKSLDHDRVLRRLSGLIEASLRTNFYQTDEEGQFKRYISLKIASQQVSDLPDPKPFREVFVGSQQVEGVHLRFGPVARGGLRWSDRRDDFRTEVLGLVKAQQVKNAVIVPVGSKGGFYPKQLPKNGSREDIQAAGIAAYKTFIRGILDLTDNYAGDRVVKPDNVVTWDGDDPYLVVAADKGTATFSDIANGISQDYGYWLDDAFASGGSAGYDHKAMGITARGGWEAVKRHFREIGKDIQSEDFTVIGVGDMSGDVFGNGMLLSKHIKLIGAFNHLDIFIDPDPNPETSFKERERLFNMDRSTWQDYDKRYISKGGGVFSRAQKSITLSPEIQALLEISEDAVTPDFLIHKLLQARAELLWFGGIGTYIKASHETHTQAGDKANDDVRVNGNQVHAAVIGEGANLGLTQAGRIEYARGGGRLNTDAIDNSAGVDSSDNEVNIKILLGGAIEGGALKPNKRDSLLEKMTDDVARHVLQHNYDQTGALSQAEMRALEDHKAYERFMQSLEQRGALDRKVENLPGSETMLALEAEKIGLTRPEISVLMAYSKNTLFDEVIKTDVADDPFMDKYLVDYFPDDLTAFDAAMEGHRLRREIITSRLVNQIVDVGGPLFFMRLQEQSQGEVDHIAKAFVVAYETLKIARLRREIADLDNKVKAAAQLTLQNEITRVLTRVVAWMVRRGETGAIKDRIEMRSQLSKTVDSDWLKFLSPYDRRRAESRIKGYIRSDIPESLATDVALLRSRASGFDVTALANATGWTLPQAAQLFYDIGGRFKIDRVRAALLNTSSDVHWERLAMRHLQEDFFKAQARFAADCALHHSRTGGKASDDTGPMIQSWISDRMPTIRAYEDTVSSISKSGKWTVAKFAIVNAQLSDLLAGL